MTPTTTTSNNLNSNNNLIDEFSDSCVDTYYENVIAPQLQQQQKHMGHYHQNRGDNHHQDKALLYLSSHASGGGDENGSVMSLSDKKIGRGSSGHTSGRNPDEAVEEIARDETRCVLYLRFVTFAFLACTTIAVAATVQQLLHRAEEDKFAESFRDNANKVLESVGTILENTLMAVDSFAVSLTSYAHTIEPVQNQSWPFVTLPDMAVRASKLRSLSKIFLFSIYHYIAHKDRAAWENYAALNKGWIDEGVETQTVDPTYRGIIKDDWYSSDQINFYGERAADDDFYVVRWQCSPVLTQWDAHSWNAFQEPLIGHAMKAVMEKHGVVISTSYNIEATTVFGVQDFVGDVQRATTPAVELYSPVLADKYAHVVAEGLGDDGNATSSSDLVAFLGLSIFWQDLIEGILPLGNDGLVVVFDNAECNQTFTFQINGPQAIYLGSGDLHEPSYDHLMMSSSLSGLARFSSVSHVYTGPRLIEDFCPYSLHLYASKTMENEFITSDPITFACVAVAIFVFTSIVFLVYDTVIEKRQRKVMQSATRSSAIVSSLFPSNVRTRLYEESAAPAVGHERDHQSFSQQMRLKIFMTKTQTSSVEPINTGPIADLFEATTVLFADIKGFTKWSSTREPTAVFTLLETLYGAFDKLAEKWGVYKIETIGDSYVAVCGLPEPRKDHALAMTKFAIDMRRKTKEMVLGHLKDLVGDGTEELEIRVGLHSGPTTGGVLRGQRARFQLFGDTVNTASRMESNGQGGKIHISQATADLLIADGKGKWLVKRNELVTAKGKGEMQTFWVEP